MFYKDIAKDKNPPSPPFIKGGIKGGFFYQKSLILLAAIFFITQGIFSQSIDNETEPQDVSNQSFPEQVLNDDTNGDNADTQNIDTPYNNGQLPINNFPPLPSSVSQFPSQNISQNLPENKISNKPAVTDASVSANANSKVSLDVKGIDIVDVLKILADKGKFNISISGNVMGRVTLFLKDVNVWDALEIVLASANLAYEKRGDIIYVMTEADYSLKYGKRYGDKRGIKIFNLKYAKASGLKEIFSQMVSNIGQVIVSEATNTLVVIDIPEKINQMANLIETIDRPQETKVFELNYLSAEELEKKIPEFLTKDIGVLKSDSASNKIIVTDYPEKLGKIEKLIKAFDVKPLQVLIDAQIIELKPSKKFYAGVNWDYWIKKYFRMGGTFAIPTTSSDKLSLGTIGVGVSEAGGYKNIMEFLQIFGETKILSSPRILALNNQEAKILVGTKEVYITSAISQTGTGTAVTSQTVNFEEVGVKLYVTPTINRAGFITLKIKPEISSATRQTIKTDDKETEVPIVTTSEAETTVILKDGVGVIIGGLRKITTDKEKKQVPFLGNIPVLGWLFSNKKDEWTKNELVIILTPRIVSGDKPIESEFGEKMIEEIEKNGDAENKEEYPKEEIGGGYQKSEDKKQPAQDIGDILRKESPNNERQKEENITDENDKKNNEEKIKPNKQENYYLYLMNKIKNTASSFYLSKDNVLNEKQKKGKVKLKFIISQKGELLDEPAVIFSQGEKYLENTAKEIIKKSSPFLPFPPSEKKKKKTFEILLNF